MTGELWAAHVEVLRERAVPVEYAKRAGMRSVDLDKIREHVRKYGKEQNPFPHLPLYKGATGILIPYDDGVHFRVRADRTEVVLPGPTEGAEDHGAQTITIPRYITQAKPVAVAPYFTPGARAVAADTTAPLYITEAPVKACSLDANGFPSIGLGGVLAGAHDVAALHEHGEVLAHADLRDGIDWRGRLVIVVFDAGIIDNPMVALGAAYVAKALAREGARCRLVVVPHDHIQQSDPASGRFYSKMDQGPDDFLYRQGRDAFERLVWQSVLASPVERATTILKETPKAERAARLGDLLRELPVRAMLYHDAILADELAATLKTYYGKKAIYAAVEEFRALLSREASVEIADERPRVLITTNEGAVNDQVIDALSRMDEHLYSQNNLLVAVDREPAPPPGMDIRMVRRPTGSPVMVPLTDIALRERITRNVALVMARKEGDMPAHPPPWMAAEIQGRSFWTDIRPLTGIVETPTMRPDGTILQTPGYDKSTGLLYAPNTEFPPVDESPTAGDAKAALQTLEYIIVNYKFESPMHRAAAIAAWFAPVVPYAINGHVPVTIFDAPKRGSGKTMLVDVAALIATGREAPRMSYSTDPNEQRKVLTSSVIAGDRMILFDDAPQKFGSNVLNGFLTATVWEDRILGISKMYSGPIHSVMFVTGNNVEPLADIARRTLHVRIQCDDERPDTRSDFREKDLLAYVRANRAKLVVAILTILRAYQVAEERPSIEGAVWGSFQRWADLIAKPLIWLGLDDPCETRAAYESQEGTNASNAANMLASWFENFGSEPKLVSTVHYLIAAEQKKDSTSSATDMTLVHLGDALTALCGVGKDGTALPSTTKIGARLRSIKGSNEGGLRIVPTGEKVDGSETWRVERVGGARPGNESTLTNGASTHRGTSDLEIQELLSNV